MTTFYQLPKEIDEIFAILGGVFSLCLILYTCIHINRIIYIFPGIFTLVACIFWLLIRSRSFLNIAHKECRSIFLLLYFVFFWLLICSILSVYFRPNLYERPLIYFVLTSIMIGTVGLELFVKPVNNSLVLLQIILIGLSVSWSQLLLFPCVVGVDSWWHQMFTLNIINIHNIPEGYSYSKFPLFHLFIATTSLLTGFNYKISTMFSVSFLQILCPVLLVYLLGNFLFKNHKISLLASLSLIICNHQIYMSYWSIPNGFGTLFILYLLYFLLKLNADSRMVFAILSLLLMSTLILTHTIASIFMALILFVCCSLFKLFSTLDYKKRVPISFTYFLLFSVSVLAWWTYVSGTIYTLTEIFRLGFSIDTFDNTPQIFLHNYLISIPLSEQIFNNLGTFLFFSLSFIGCFYMISTKYGNCNTFIFAIIGFIPLSFGFFSLITSHSIIEHRWWYFAQTFLSISFAVSLVLIMNSFKINILKPLFLFFVMASISFLLVMSPPANADNHFFSPNSSMTSSLTVSELQAVKKTSSFFDGTIKTDTYYASSQSFTYNCESFSYELYSKNMDSSLQDFVLIRKAIVDKPLKLFSSVVLLDYDPRDLLSNSYFSKVYDCESVGGYLKI